MTIIYTDNDFRKKKLKYSQYYKKNIKFLLVLFKFISKEPARDEN